ncbi:MAG: phosphoesterase [Candidatus Limnocylindrales bacterium]
MPESEALIMAVARERFPDDLGWRGVRTEGIDGHLGAITRAATFRPRPALENDPAWKQIVPYLILRDGPRVFLMQRTRAGGDARLHDRWSIGVGGHVEQGDGDHLGGLRREWQEEIEADFVPEWRLVGLLNDDETPVGAVHLGLVYEADAAGRPVAIRETHKLRGAFATIDEVEAHRDDLESWSAFALDAIRERHAVVG